MTVLVLGIALEALSAIAEGAGRHPTMREYAAATLERIAHEAADAWPVVYCVRLEAAGAWCGAEFCHELVRRLGSTPDGRPVYRCRLGHYTAVAA